MRLRADVSSSWTRWSKRTSTSRQLRSTATGNNRSLKIDDIECGYVETAIWPESGLFSGEETQRIVFYGTLITYS